MVNNHWEERITGKQSTHKAQCPQLETGVWPIRERFGCWQWGKCFFQLDHGHTFLAAHECIIFPVVETENGHVQGGLIV